MRIIKIEDAGDTTFALNVDSIVAIKKISDGQCRVYLPGLSYKINENINNAIKLVANENEVRKAKDVKASIKAHEKE